MESLEDVNLPDKRDQYPAELSGGQKKRIGLARTLILTPDIILYDEPTTGLDPVSRPRRRPSSSSSCATSAASRRSRSRTTCSPPRSSRTGVLPQGRPDRRPGHARRGQGVRRPGPRRVLQGHRRLRPRLTPAGHQALPRRTGPRPVPSPAPDPPRTCPVKPASASSSCSASSPPSASCSSSGARATCSRGRSRSTPRSSASPGSRRARPCSTTASRSGRVEQVALPDAPGEPITVRMQIQDKARNLIREDSRALIQTDGLVGNVIVALTDGTRDTPQIAENGQIAGRGPVRPQPGLGPPLHVGLALRLGHGPARGHHDGRPHGRGLARALPLRRAPLRRSPSRRRRSSRRRCGRSPRAPTACCSWPRTPRNGVNAILQKVNTGNGTVARFLNEDQVYTTFLATATQLQQSAAQFQSVAAGRARHHGPLPERRRAGPRSAPSASRRTWRR